MTRGEPELVLGDLAVRARAGASAPRAEPVAVVATDAAIAEIRRLQAEHGPLEFFQSGGCCDGSSPMCFQAGDFRVGAHDLLVGEVEGCPFYVDAEQYERWGKPSFVLDVGPGGGSGMSLEGIHDVHFRLDEPVCAADGRPSGTRSPPGALSHARIDDVGRDTGHRAPAAASALEPIFGRTRTTSTRVLNALSDGAFPAAATKGADRLKGAS